MSPLHLSAGDWLAFAWHFLSLSVFSVGGVLVTVPAMHSFMVDQRHWLTHLQFTSSIALAQAAPGPNVLLVALLGLSVGSNVSAGLPSGPLSWWPRAVGLLAGLLGILIPSATIACFAGRWFHRRQSHPNVRAFRNGMAPIVIALLFATAWLMVKAPGAARNQSIVYVLASISAVIVWRTRIHTLWLMAAGALIGANWLT